MRRTRYAFLLAGSIMIGGCAGAPPLPEFTVAHPASKDAPEAPVVARPSSLAAGGAAARSMPETAPTTSAKSVDPAEEPVGGENHGGHRR